MNKYSIESNYWLVNFGDMAYILLASEVNIEAMRKLSLQDPSLVLNFSPHIPILTGEIPKTGVGIPVRVRFVPSPTGPFWYMDSRIWNYSGNRVTAQDSMLFYQDGALTEGQRIGIELWEATT